MTRYAGTELSNYMSMPNFTGLGRTMMEGASLGRQTVNAAEGDVALAGINSQAKIKSAGYEAEAIKAGGQARGQAAMFQGLGSMASGIAGGFGARGGGGYGGYGSGSIDTSSVDNSIASVNAYEKANPFTSMSGNSYNNFSGWTDPATGRTY